MERSSAVSLPWSASCRPEVAQAGRYPLLEKNCGYVYRSPTIALHQHGYEGRVRIGAVEFELRPGDVTLTPAQVDSVYDLPRNGYHLCLHFRLPQARQPPLADGVPILQLPLHIRLGTGSNSIRQRIWWITDLHRRAEHADARKRALAAAAASAGLQELILTLALAEPAEHPAAPVSSRVETALVRAVERIESRLKLPLPVPALAEHTGLSQNYLARAFRHRYGMTIPRFILLRRIELARHLLATSKAAIKQVAYEVGLPDVQHFNKQFRRLAGVSPSAYRGGLEPEKGGPALRPDP
jgi:AraC family transcriptional regulator